MTQGGQWPVHPSTVTPDDGPLAQLSRRDKRRMRRAMILGRPVPPRLARAAVEYAPELQREAWVGYLSAGMAVLYVLLGVVGIVHWVNWWMPVAWMSFGVAWLLLGLWWLWAVRRAGKTVREGRWPERPASD
jgi:hypothetical protein